MTTDGAGAECDLPAWFLGFSVSDGTADVIDVVYVNM